MRWDNLSLEAERHRTLPGYREPAAVRTFDAPEALDVRFYEVRAKSALNRVPKASQMPFRWTINPYRGCLHACPFCLAGDTPILMADGRTKPMREIKVGDRVYGTARRGRYRRYVPTEVLVHWQTVKDAYRITVEDGRELIASADHRFLTDRGWKYVTDTGPGRVSRAHLTLNNRLIGTGPFVTPPDHSVEYRRGYMCGLIRGDGHFGSYSYDYGDVHSFRLALTDIEALYRARDYLAELEVATAERVFQAAAAGRREVRTIGVSSRDKVGLIRSLVTWPDRETEDWRKGFLAGIKTDARLRVTSIEPLGARMALYDMTTGTGDFVANGVVSHNCFARPTHTYLDFDAGRDFEREIVVKVNAPEVLRVELGRPSWKREHVALGTNTDPYQWVEGRYRLMRGIWEALRDSRTPCSVLTKSPLLLRDIDLMKEIHERAGFAANLSVPTLEEKAWRETEPHTPHPRKRLEAVAELNRAGIPCGVLIAPLMPGINDDPRQVERILELASEAGASEIGGICLHLRGEVRRIFMDWLRSQRPDLVPRYERLYARGAYAPKRERERLAALTHPGGRLPPRARQEATKGGRLPPQAGHQVTKAGRPPRRAGAPVADRDPAEEAQKRAPAPEPAPSPPPRQARLF